MVAIVRPTPAAFGWAEPMHTIGVTGTNGKTSTTHLIAAILEAAGRPSARLSTVGARIGAQAQPQPQSLQDMYDLLERAHAAGCDDAVIEVTSRSLALGYAKHWRFDLGVFTNLSPDHLTTHGSWENYLAAKAQLFIHLGPGRHAVLNAGDRHAHMLAAAIPGDVHRQWFWAPGRDDPGGVAPRLRATTVTPSATGTTIELAPSPDADALGGTLRIRMVGAVFGDNALAAATTGLALELPPAAIVAGLADCPPVPGRFEIVATAPTCVVDYAHTPDALARTCDAARAIVTGRLIVVFGAGGGATPEKRAPMGEVVGARADVVILTTDNPRDEDPAVIAAQLQAGVVRGGRARIEVELDRAAAIARGLDEASADDIVVVAGRGPDRFQQIGDERRELVDAEVIRAHRGTL